MTGYTAVRGIPSTRRKIFYAVMGAAAAIRDLDRKLSDVGLIA